jgi:transposase
MRGLADAAGQPQQEGAGVQRRIVGLDLGVATDHTAVILDQTGSELARRRVRPTRASLEALRAAALAGVQAGVAVEVVIEPTGPAWLPVAVFFAAIGDVVYRVSSQKAADLRRYYRRHHKTNRIDATTLARIAILEGDALRPVELARGVAAELDREVRVTERLTEEIAARKVRIRDLARQLMPTSGQAFSATIAHTDLEILRAWGDPTTLLAQGIQALTEFVTTVSQRMHGRAKAAAWLAAAAEAVQLYGHVARTVPGIADKGGPLATTIVGRAGRFPNADRFASYTGLVPGASETGDTDRKCQAITKAGNRKLRRMLYRLWRVLERQTPYVVCDINGRPVTPDQAKQIIAERYTVPEDIRRRRRSKKKAGKAPHQVLEGHAIKPGTQSAGETRRPSPTPILATTPT